MSSRHSTTELLPDSSDRRHEKRRKERKPQRDPDVDTLSHSSHDGAMNIVHSSDLETLESHEKELPPFKATPQVISQYLEMPIEAIMEKMHSKAGRDEIFQNLMEHEEVLRKDHSFNPDEFRSQLEAAGEFLDAKEDLLKDAKSPEKKGFFRRALNRVRGFAGRHPIVTTLLVMALAASAVAGGFYLAGQWEQLMGYLGVGHLFGSGGASGAAEHVGTVVDPGSGIGGYFSGAGSGGL